jgi:glyoxylase-like metal-dependent hydrolase (beta-lactamase superfamily II)
MALQFLGGTMRFTIGEVRVDVIIDDDDFELPLGHFLPGSDTRHLIQHSGVLEPEFLDFDRDVVKFAVQSFLVRVNGRALLIDTCIGEQKDRPEIPVWHQRRGTGFLERLAETGIGPADVDIVFCTHLHVDHVGWNTRRADGRWIPTFPNARYLVGRNELADWMGQHAAGSAPQVHASALQDSVLPVLDAALVDLVEDGYDVAEGVALTHLPGHTAGQMGLRINRHDGRAIFCGDALHSPVQIFDTDVSTSSCADPRVAAATRRTLLEDAVETNRLVVPAHFRGRRCAYIRRNSAGFTPVFSCPPE